MSWLTRYDLVALAPPQVSDAVAPAAWLSWCRDGTGACADTACSDTELDALMLEIDGTRRLQTLPSRQAALAWRIGLKLREALGLRRADDPWDAGWLRSVDALLQFEPRRPTLIVAGSQQQAARDLLAARQPLWRQPVRLLISARPNPSGT